MADGIDLAVVQAAAAAKMQQKLAETPWWKKKANTITVIGTWIGFAASSVIASGMDLPLWAWGVLAVVLFVAQVFGVSVTKNGPTLPEANRVQEVITDPAVLDLLIRALPDHLENAARHAARAGAGLLKDRDDE